MGGTQIGLSGKSFFFFFRLVYIYEKDLQYKLTRVRPTP
jgi:hypothetical protein